MASPGTGFFTVNSNQDPILDAMLHGYYWVLDWSRSIDYSVSSGLHGEYWDDPADVRAHMQLAMDMYASYLNLSFNDSGFFSSPQAAYYGGSEINLSLTASNYLQDSTGAVGLFPSPSLWDSWLYPGAYGDIYLNLNSRAAYLPSYEPGSLGWSILIHEIGHVLGLKHPHDDGDTSSPTFDDIGLGNIDVDWATIMSYNDSSYSDYSGHPETPMFLDVLALQALYGSNTSTNAGNTVHRLVNYNNTYQTIWDASGTDTLDLSGVNKGWHIELPDEIIMPTVSNLTGLAAPTYDYDQIENRFYNGWSYTPSTVVWLIGDYEDVIGSRYNDIFEGNRFNNYIDGGSGVDECILIGGLSDYDIECFGGTQNKIVIYDNVSGRGGQDTYINVENFNFNETVYSYSQLAELATPDLIQTTLTSSSASLLETGDKLYVTLTFDENVVLNGSAGVTLDIGGTSKTAMYQSGSGSSSLLFSYTIEDNLSFDNTVNVNIGGSYLASNIADTAGNVANLTGLSGSLSNLKINYNTIPQAVNGAYSVDEDLTLTGNLPNATDADGDQLTYQLGNVSPSHGVLQISSDGSFSYTPDDDYFGYDSFTYKVNDGKANSNKATITIDVRAINDAPVAYSTSLVTDQDNSLYGSVPTATDVDSASLSYQLFGVLPQHGELVLNANGTFTYTPFDGYYGTDSFGYKAYDGDLHSNEAIATITINRVNHLPVISNLTISMEEDGSFTGSLPATSDPDGDEFSYIYGSSAVEHGQLSLNSDGTFTYLPNEDFFGTDSFTYYIDDGFGVTQEATVTLVVDPVNDVPLSFGQTITLDEDSYYVGFLPLAIDPDDASLTYQLGGLSVENTYGSGGRTTHGGYVTLSPNGSFNYSPDGNYNGIDSFTYRVFDGETWSAESVITFDINPVNDVPTGRVSLENDLVPQGQDVGVSSSSIGQDQIDVTGLVSGGYVVTWRSFVSNPSNGYWEIKAQKFDSNGLALGDEFFVNHTLLGRQIEPSVAALEDGGWVVSWKSNHLIGPDYVYYNVFYQRYSSDGVKIGSEIQVSQDVVGDQKIISLDDGGWLVAWSTDDYTGVYFKKYDSLGNEVASVVQISNGIVVDIDLALLHGGDLVVVYEKYVNGEGKEIYGQVFDATGAKVGAEFLVNTFGAGQQESPVVAALMDDGWVVAWQSDDQDGSGVGVYSQRYNSLGEKVGAEVLVNTTIEGDQGHWNSGNGVSITGLSDGGWMVVWESSNFDRSGQGIFGQKYHSDGSLNGGEFQLNTKDTAYTTPQITEPTVSTLSNGDVITLWEHEGEVTQRLYKGAALGDVLTPLLSDISDADGLGSLTYQWYANDKAIHGATAESFTITEAEVDANISLRVSYVDGQGNYESFLTGIFSNSSPVLAQYQDFSLLQNESLDSLVSVVDDNNDFLYFVEGYTEPSHGLVQLNADGTFLYTPDEGYYGYDEFSFIVSDGSESIEETLRIAVRHEVVGSSLGGDVFGTEKEDFIRSGIEADVIHAGNGDDLVQLTSNTKFKYPAAAKNLSSLYQTGTDELIGVGGKLSYSDVIDGGLGHDAIQLSDSADAFALHDALSAYHGSISLASDTLGYQSYARIHQIEKILGGAGDDVIDLTSQDYSLDGQSMLVNGGEDDDVIWGADSDDVLLGGDGDDVLFGGSGVNELTGGEGADEFQFTKTSVSDTVVDFSLDDGDSLVFFNTGGADFDKGSIQVNSGKLSIYYAANASIEIQLSDLGLTAEDLESSIYVV